MINQTLANFAEAMSNIPDNKSVSLDVKKILDSIPQELDPNAVLGVLTTKSGNFLKMLEGANSKEEITKCITRTYIFSNDSNCEKLLTDPSKREFLGDLIGKEVIDVQESFVKKMSTMTEDKYSRNLVTVKEKILSENSRELSSLLHSYDNPLENRDESNRVLLNEKTDQVIAYSEKLFQKQNPNSKGGIKNGFSAIGLKDTDYESLVTLCKIPAGIKGEQLKEGMDSCHTKVQALMKQADDTAKEIDTQTAKLTQDLDQVLNHNQILKNIEGWIY